MKQFLFDNKKKVEIEEIETVATPSTLLIPKIYLKELEQKILEYGSLNEYLTYLLREYDLFLKTGILPESQDLKTVYQLKDQNLQRKDFRPAKQDWFLLKLYRVGLNYSISYLFVFLLRLDLLSLARIVKSALNIVGVPFPEPIFQHGGLSINAKRSEYSRIFQFD
jgi:hypothetical protein